jgi:hypothetical protein
MAGRLDFYCVVQNETLAPESIGGERLMLTSNA